MSTHAATYERIGRCQITNKITAQLQSKAIRNRVTKLVEWFACYFVFPSINCQCKKIFLVVVVFLLVVPVTAEGPPPIFDYNSIILYYYNSYYNTIYIYLFIYNTIYLYLYIAFKYSDGYRKRRGLELGLERTRELRNWNCGECLISSMFTTPLLHYSHCLWGWPQLGANNIVMSIWWKFHQEMKLICEESAVMVDASRPV